MHNKPMHITSETKTLTFKTQTLELLKHKVHICNSNFLNSRLIVMP